MNNATAELLAPAGNPEALDAAIAEGADAVYLGLKNFNARMRTGNFAYSQFEAAVEALHKQGKRLYVTVNTVFEQREADRMYQLLQYLEKVGPDGVIVQDLGVVKMVRECFPGLRLHASTQMNVGSAAGAAYLGRLGFKRVVLSRELSLAEMKAVRSGTTVELETFVHGALCVSASGLCLFSSYLGGRSANRGACTQACRRIFSDESRDGYFFSPDDLQLVDKVPELVEAGLTTFKIEGRMKSAEYVGTVVAAYRYMLDNWRFDRERAAAKAQAMLQGDFARRKTTFWYDGTVAPDFIRPDQAGGTGIPLGKIKVIRVIDDKRWIVVKGFEGVAEGDSIRIHGHGDTGRTTAKVREAMEKPEGLYLRVDGEFGPEDEVYLVQTKSMSRRYKPVLPASLSKYHRFPSYDEAPKPGFPAIPKDRLAALPDGLYSMVGRVQDLHTILADRPEKAILRLSRKNAELLRRHEKETPFKRGSLVLWLEPYFPQADAEWLSAELDYWIGRGQSSFVANNIGHLAMLEGRGLTVIAGPWLYAFNSWAAAFLLGSGLDFLVPPLEISKQAFGKLAESVPGKSLLVTAFAYPQLFTIRSDLGAAFDLRFVNDREGEGYEVVSSPDGSVVIPMKPFSLVDRIPSLKKTGAAKFILDFSFIELRKQVYKRVVQAARDATVLPDTGRFNWKDGFWNPDEAAGQAAPEPGSRPAARGRAGRPEGGDEGAAGRRRGVDSGDRPRDQGAAGKGSQRGGRASGKPARAAEGYGRAGERPGKSAEKSGRSVDRPGRGGPPWKVALAEGRSRTQAGPSERKPKNARGSDATSSTPPSRRGPAGGSGARRPSPSRKGPRA